MYSMSNLLGLVVNLKPAYSIHQQIKHEVT